MKKLNTSDRKWFEIRARNQARRKYSAIIKSQNNRAAGKAYISEAVQIWQGGEPEWAICTRKPTPAPKRLSFRTDQEQTVGFFSRIRRNFLWRKDRGDVNFISRKNPRATPRINGYVDFSKIEHISTAAAVVLTADYNRLAVISGQVPPTIDLHKWNNSVFTRLYQIGFFSTLGHISGIEEHLIEDGPTMTMQILCATNGMGLAKVDTSLQELGRFLFGDGELQLEELDGTIVKVLTAISEAITNVTQHAYPSDHKYEFEHISSFWVAATADRVKRTLTVIVYDQGASIPITYPRLRRTEKVLRFLRRTTGVEPEFDYQYDGTYIRAAMRYGGSRTDKPYRGKGFPQMFQILQSVGAGRMSIRSRGGWCQREPNGRISSGYLSESIGGTLVEWEIDIPANGLVEWT